MLTSFFPLSKTFEVSSSLKGSWPIRKKAWIIPWSVGMSSCFEGDAFFTLAMLHCYSIKTIISLLSFQDIVVRLKWHLYIYKGYAHIVWFCLDGLIWVIALMTILCILCIYVPQKKKLCNLLNDGSKYTRYQYMMCKREVYVKLIVQVHKRF